MAAISIWGEVKLPSFETPYMARDFGLDITVPEGGLVTSAANQKQYKADCGRIYKEFVVTMGDYFQEEEELKRHLKRIHSQKKYGNQIGGSFRMDDNMSDTLGSRTGCFVTKTIRPQTVGMFAKRQSVCLPHPPDRPATVAEYTRGGHAKKRFSLSRRRSSINMPVTATCEGVIDLNMQNTRERMLKMNSTAYAKLLAGGVSINVKHKGKFVLKQVAVENRPQSALSRDPMRAVDIKDKTAIVRQKTNYKSPTLSSDLKINNLVAIQKSLMGIPSKRVTVGEIMEKAKDRRARIFRVELDGSQDKHDGICNSPVKFNTVPVLNDDVNPMVGNERIKVVNVGAWKRRNSSVTSMSQDREDVKQHTESILRSARETPFRGRKVTLKPKPVDGFKISTYIDTSGKRSDDPDSDQSEKGTPRKVTARDVMVLIRQSQDDDNEREQNLSRWRQRMTFAAVKKSQLARILARARTSVTS